MENPIHPLPRNIYDKAKAHGITRILLFFKGGDDNGYLNVELVGNNDGFDCNFGLKFEAEVEAWAWTVYEYGGAGEGVDYGDNIIYDLEENTVTTQAWYYDKRYDTPEKSKLEISEGEGEGDEE